MADRSAEVNIRGGNKGVGVGGRAGRRGEERKWNSEILQLEALESKHSRNQIAAPHELNSH